MIIVQKPSNWGWLKFLPSGVNMEIWVSLNSQKLRPFNILNYVGLFIYLFWSAMVNNNIN